MSNKKKFSIKTVLLVTVVILLVWFAFSAGYHDGHSDANNKSEKITEVLNENCECDEINQIIYAKGVQFGKDGASTEKAEYLLIDCSYKSISEEAIRINKILMKEVPNYDEIDLLTLEFNNDQNRETVTIKNGVIQ